MQQYILNSKVSLIRLKRRLSFIRCILLGT